MNHSENMNNIKQLNTPTLRFPDFSDEWEKRKLQEVATVNPSNSKLPDEFFYIDLESVEKGVLLKKKIQRKETAPSRAQRLLEKNDVLFQTVRPYQQNNYFFELNGSYVASTGYAQFRTKQIPKFLYQYLHTKKFLNNVLVRCTGTSYPAITGNELKKIRINIPSLPEQQKISSFLSSVDAWIENLRAQKKNLEDYKKGLMQKIFSQEIRFKDENGEEFTEWEEKVFKYVAKFFSGGTPESTNRAYYTGNVPFIKSGEICSLNTAQFITEDAIAKSSAKKVNIGDLLYALYGATSGCVAISCISGAINQAVLCIRTDQDKRWLYNYLSYQKGRLLAKYLQGGQGNLSADIIKNIKIDFPIINEQQMIAEFLTSIDNLIKNKQQQITSSEQWKKGLMQGLFV